MNKITITTANNEHTYETPATFDEMTREQFILTAKKILLAAAGTDDEAYYPAITGIEPKIWDKLHFFQKYSIERLFDYTAETPVITKQLLPYIEIGGVQYIGYQPGFSNTTWQEFIFADQYVLNGKYPEAAACLYRPQRSDYTGETDRRIPFTIYGVNTRLPHFKTIPETELLSFVLNYKALRKRNLEEAYPFVFPSQNPDKAQATNDDPKNNFQFLTFNSQFSWISLHRTLMGDQFYDEQKFYAINVHIILNRLNTVIRDNRRKT